MKYLLFFLTAGSFVLGTITILVPLPWLDLIPGGMTRRPATTSAMVRAFFTSNILSRHMYSILCVNKNSGYKNYLLPLKVHV